MRRCLLSLCEFCGLDSYRSKYSIKGHPCTLGTACSCGPPPKRPSQLPTPPVLVKVPVLVPAGPGWSDRGKRNLGSACVCSLAGEAERLFTCLLVSRVFGGFSVRVIALFPAQRRTHVCVGNAPPLPGMQCRCKHGARSSCGQFYELGFGARRVPLPGAGLLPGNNCTNLMAPLSLPCRENREDPDGVPPLLRGPVWCGSLQQHATRDRGHRGATGPAALAQGERRWARGRAASMASVSHCCWMVSKGRTRLLNRQVTWWWCRGPFSTVGDSPGPAPSSAELGL